MTEKDKTEKLERFFKTRPVQELEFFSDYFDYKSLYRDILTPENQINLPKPIEEINAYRKLYSDERAFRKLGFDYDNLGVDLKEYFDYDLYTKEFISIFQIEEADVSQIIGETEYRTDAEIEAWFRSIPQIYSSSPTPKDCDEEERDIDDLEYIDDEYEEMSDNFLDEER